MRQLLSSHFGYIVVLLMSWFGLLALDWRRRLALWRYPKAAAITIGVGVVGFGLWDISGLALHIFSTNQRYVTGWHVVSPNVPIEEIIFLGLLSYVTLLGTALIQGEAGP